MIKLCGLFVSTLIFLPTNFSPSSEVGLWILFSRYNIFFPVVLVQATASLSETPLITCLPTSPRDLCVPPHLPKRKHRPSQVATPLQTPQCAHVPGLKSDSFMSPLRLCMISLPNQPPLSFLYCIGVLSVPAPAKFLTALHLLCLLPGVLLSSFQSSVQTSYPQGGNL